MIRIYYMTSEWKAITFTKEKDDFRIASSQSIYSDEVFGNAHETLEILYDYYKEN